MWTFNLTNWTGPLTDFPLLFIALVGLPLVGNIAEHGVSVHTGYTILLYTRQPCDHVSGRRKKHVWFEQCFVPLLEVGPKILRNQLVLVGAPLHCTRHTSRDRK